MYRRCIGVGCKYKTILENVESHEYWLKKLHIARKECHEMISEAKKLEIKLACSETGEHEREVPEWFYEDINAQIKKWEKKFLPCLLWAGDIANESKTAFLHDQLRYEIKKVLKLRASKKFLDKCVDLLRGDILNQELLIQDLHYNPRRSRSDIELYIVVDLLEKRINKSSDKSFFSHSEKKKREIALKKAAEQYVSEGYKYEMGQGLSKSYKMAFEFYKKAAKIGDKTGYNNLAWLYLNGFGVKKSIDKAEKLFIKAAAKGEVLAMVNLGNIYGSEYGPDSNLIDEEVSTDWYRLAAERGSSKGLFNFANNCHWGQGIKQNYRMSYLLFKELYKENYEGTAFYLGLYHEEGLYVKQDLKAARQYYQIGAEQQKDAYCFLHLGRLYGEGKGVEKNEMQAHFLYEKAAELGDTLAYVNLGYQFENGMDLAVAYYTKAALAGEELGKEALKRLGKEMPG